MSCIINYDKATPIDGEAKDKYLLKLSVKAEKIIGYTLVAHNERGGIRYSIVLIHEGGKVVLETFSDEDKAQEMFANLQAGLA